MASTRHNKRVFTEQELKDMGRRTVDLICEAADAEDKEKVKKLAHRMYRESESMHDLLVDVIAGVLTYIHKHYGDDILYEALHEGMSGWFKPMAEAYEKADFRRRVQMFAAGFRGHLQPVKIEEDDEKVCIQMQPCGSCHRQFKNGAYGPPISFSIVKKPQSLTFNMPDCPVYCVLSAMFEILPIEWYGHPEWVCHPGEGFAKTGECPHHIYKDPEDIPEEIYTRVGKRKLKGVEKPEA